MPSQSYFSNLTLALVNLLRIETKQKEELFKSDDPWQRMIACHNFLKNVHDRSEPTVVFVTNDYNTMEMKKVALILCIMAVIMFLINRFLR